MSKKTLAQRVLVFLKGGDEAKLQRFESKLEKYFSKQISQRKDFIETLQEKIIDAKERLNDVILSVDINKVNAVEGAEGYCPVYVQTVQNQLNVIKELEFQIEAIQEEIDSLDEVQEAINNVPDEAKIKA